MLGRLRRGASYSSSNHGTSYYSAEKLALFGAMHLASNRCSLLNLVLTQRADNTFAPGGRSKHRLLQSCHPSVECPPLPSLTLKHAKTCDRLRSMPKQLITVSAQTISAQTDCRPMDWVLSQTHPQDQANAMLLQTDRGLARRPMGCRRAAALQKTVRSTGLARDHRNSPRVWSGHHLDQASAYRRNRNRRPAAG